MNSMSNRKPSLQSPYILHYHSSLYNVDYNFMIFGGLRELSEQSEKGT